MLLNERRWLVSRHAISALLSLLLLVLALVALWAGHHIKTEQPDTVMVRELAIARPPPPPPPPAVEQPAVEIPLTVLVQGAGAALQVLTINPQPIDVSKPKLPKLTTVQPQWQSLDINLDAFNLADLDAMPTLLTPLRVTFPKSLSRRGVNSALIKLDVIIDERGRLSLLNVVENPYPELRPEINKLVRNSRFSAPMKGQEVVRARFIWPVEIKP